MSLYLTKQTHRMNYLICPPCLNHGLILLGQWDQTLGPNAPSLGTKLRSLYFSSVPSMALSQHSQDTPQLEDLMADTQDTCAIETSSFN